MTSIANTSEIKRFIQIMKQMTQANKQFKKLFNPHMYKVFL